jgi:hypothetical protein
MKERKCHETTGHNKPVKVLYQCNSICLTSGFNRESIVNPEQKGILTYNRFIIYGCF